MLPAIQLDVLGVVESERSRTTSEVARNILIEYGRAKSALDALERKGLVSRTYTGRDFVGSSYGWNVTGNGRAELRAAEAGAAPAGAKQET